MADWPLRLRGCASYSCGDAPFRCQAGHDYIFVGGRCQDQAHRRLHGKPGQPIASECHVDRLCAAWAPQLQKQCQLCGGGYKRRDQHASACPIIFQYALARVRAAVGERDHPTATDGGDGGGNADAKLLRADPKRGHDTEEEDKEKDRPSKTPKTENANGKGKGHRRGGRTAGASDGSWEGSQRSSRKSMVPDAPPTEGMMLLIARLLLRQDEAISVMRQSTGFVLWLRTTPAVIIPKIVGVAKVWKEQTTKADSPAPQSTLRSTLLWTMLHQCLLYVDQISKEEETKQHAIQQG